MYYVVIICAHLFPPVAVCYICLYSTEKILEGSGASIAPPERPRSARIRAQNKPQQEGLCIHRNSDIAEYENSGSEYEEEEELEEKSEDEEQGVSVCLMSVGE